MLLGNDKVELMTDHEIKDPATKENVVESSQNLAVNYLAWIGPIVTLVGALSYFLYFFQFADFRDFPWVNLPLVAFGVILSIAGLRKAFSSTGYKFLSKSFATLGFLFSLGLGALFCIYIFFLSYQMPGVEGVSQVAEAAPDFALPDQDNKTVKLTDFQEKKLVISFYRGHW